MSLHPSFPTHPHRADLCVIGGGMTGLAAALALVTDNHQRLVRLPIESEPEGVRFALETTWGGETTRVYAFSFT